MGDVLMTIPTVRALKETYPDAVITYVTGKGLTSALSGLPFLAQVREFDKTLAGFREMAPWLRRLEFDLCVNLQPSLKTRLLALASGAKRTLTYRRDDALHAVDNALATLLPLGIQREKCSRHTEFSIPDDAREKAAALLAERGIGPSEKLILVTPGATAPSRQWPVANLVAVLDLFAEQHPDWRVGFFGGVGDKALAEEAMSKVARPERVLNFIGATNLKESGALLARADALMTVNTGPMHLAAAVGCPIVALFGAWSAERTAPAPPPPAVPRGRIPLTLTSAEGLDCFPCFEKTCRRGDTACLARLAPETILEALEQQV